MEWFMSLNKEELSSFKQIQENFLLKYQYKVEPKPTFLNLAKEMMEPSENWFTYANRWRDMAARSGLEIAERQMVQKLIANTTGPMKKGLANAYCPSISALYEVAASVWENIHEFEEPQPIEDDIEDDIDQTMVQVP